MAGTRHHIIPKFLQKGFASEIQKKKGKEIVFTWMYRKEAEPCRLATTNIGVEEHFYGRNGEPNVDDKITLLETYQYAPLLKKLRTKSDKTGVVVVNEPLIADFISHLCTRTKNFRESFSQSTDYCMAEIDNYFSDFIKIKNFLIKHPAKSENFIKLKAMAASNPNILDSRKTEIESLFQSFFIAIKSEFPRLVKETHNHALIKISSSQVIVESCRRMRWFLYSFNRPSVILGDSGCLFEIAGLKDYKIFYGKDEKIRQVFLPIAANKLLIGTISGTPKINIKKINREMAKCSQEFFIYSEKSEEMAKLASLIGTKSGILSQVDLEQIISKVLQSY